MIRPGIRRLFRLRRAERVAQETDEEIEAHLTMRAKQLEAQGLSPEAARAEAVRRFGPVDEARRALLRAAHHRERRVGVRAWLDDLRQDLRYAWRSVVREPGFAAVVIVVIALGVGANAAMFGIIDRLLLRGPEHVVEPDRVARIYITTDEPSRGRETASSFGYVTYTTLRDQTRSFERVAAYAEGLDETLGAGEGAEQISTGYATWDFFPLLGVRPALGRFFNETEDRPGSAQRMVVLGYGLWQRRFAADPAIVGRTVSLNGSPYTVVGVAPKGFTGAELQRVDLWRPMSLNQPCPDWTTTWSCSWLRVVARLKPGVTAEQASADATTAFRHAYTRDLPYMQQASISASPLSYDEHGGPAMEVAVSRWLVGVSLVVLLIACANVANLLLARAVRRRREVAVRLALGITRGRLVRLLLSESMLLACLGGVAALLVVPVAGGLVRATLLSNIEWTGSAVSGRVLLVAGVLTLLTGIVTGLVPAVHAGRRNLLGSLHTGAREGGGRSSRLRAGLAVTQAALSVVLLVGAGLFVRSLRNAHAVDLGIEPDRVLTVRASWPPRPADESPSETFTQRSQRIGTYYERALDRVRSTPDVEHAALVIGTPFHSTFHVGLRVAGWDSIPKLPGGGPYIQSVSSGYFSTVGLQLLRGRVFTRADHAGTEPVAVVNETMARTLWPRGQAIGKFLHIGSGAHESSARIVGIVEDAHRYTLREEPAMQYYIPFGQEWGIGGTMLLVRPRNGTAAAMMQPIRSAVHDVDPNVLWLNVKLLQDQLDPQFRPWRLGATLIGAFGALALLIAAVGLYSLIAYMVASRVHELGVRMALGASGSNVLRLVLWRGLLLAGGGLALGVVLSLFIAPRIQELLFNTSPHDPLIYGAVVAVLLVAAVLASLVPARRAAHVNPVEALRAE